MQPYLFGLFTSGDSALVYKCNFLLLTITVQHGGIETNELRINSYGLPRFWVSQILRFLDFEFPRF